MTANHGQQLIPTYAEWHALIIGIADTMTLNIPPRRLIGDKIAKEIAEEYHYYQAGRIMGIFGLVGVAALVKALFF